MISDRQPIILTIPTGSQLCRRGIWWNKCATPPGSKRSVLVLIKECHLTIVMHQFLSFLLNPDFNGEFKKPSVRDILLP